MSPAFLYNQLFLEQKRFFKAEYAQRERILPEATDGSESLPAFLTLDSQAASAKARQIYRFVCNDPIP